MAEKAFYSAKKGHADTDGLGPIPSWAEGVDTFKATVPTGEKFTRYEIVRKNMLADCQVIEAPKLGARGNVELQVKWNYTLFGTVDYRVRLYCADGKPRAVVIDVGSEGWDQRALDLIRQGVPFKLRLKGPDALTVFNLLSPRSVDTIRKSYELNDDDAGRSTAVHAQPRVADPVTLAIVAALTLIALAGFATLAFVIQKAVDAGKCVNAKHSVSGPSPIDDSLEVDIHEC